MSKVDSLSRPVSDLLTSEDFVKISTRKPAVDLCPDISFPWHSVFGKDPLLKGQKGGRR